MEDQQDIKRDKLASLLVDIDSIDGPKNPNKVSAEAAKRAFNIVAVIPFLIVLFMFVSGIVLSILFCRGGMGSGYECSIPIEGYMFATDLSGLLLLPAMVFTLVMIIVGDLVFKIVNK